MKPIFLLLFLVLVSISNAQVTQNGQVRELNSNKKPIKGAQILFTDASSEISDQAGNFSLKFQDKKPGDLIFMERIYKQGYELVNKKDFEITKISNTNRLGVDVILAITGTVDAAKKVYYDVSDAALLASFKREKRNLKNQVQKAQLSQQKYIDSLTVLQEAYQRQQASLDALAERFARVNFDDVESYYEEALTLFKAGKIDQAISVLESANPFQRTEQILKEEKRIVEAQVELDSQRVALKREKKKQIETVHLLADMYRLKFDPVKAEAQYDQLIRLDSTDIEIICDAADFYRENHRYNKALRLYLNIIYHPEADVWQTRNAYLYLGDLYTNTGDLQKALKVFKQSWLSYDTLAKVSNNNISYKLRKIISYFTFVTFVTSLFGPKLGHF